VKSGYAIMKKPKSTDLMLEVVSAVDIVIRLQVYILSFLMLLVMYVQLVKAGVKSFLQHHLFKLLILSTMSAVSMEAVSWVFDGRPGQTARDISTAANVLLLSCNIMPLTIWTLYVDLQIYNDMSRIRKSLIPHFVLLITNAFFAVTAPINGLYFYLDTGNSYHRGPLAPAAIALYYLFFVYNIFMVIKHWKHLSRRNRTPLLLFAFPPLLGFFFQMVYYGTNLVWAGVSLSILMVYITVQNQVMSTDYLTDLYNRRQLDYYLESRIKSLSKHQQLAGIMLDIDNFKQINDKYGHITGDRAIETAASILKHYFEHNDFIARYAGDEFVILPDIREGEALADIVDGLRKQVALYNEKSKEPFEIQFSIGYAIYAADSGQKPAEFLNQLDKLMYADKASRRAK